MSAWIGDHVDGAVLPPHGDMVNWHLQPVKPLVLKTLVPVSHQQFLKHTLNI